MPIGKKHADWETEKPVSELASRVKRHSYSTDMDRDALFKQELRKQVHLALQASCYRPVRRVTCVMWRRGLILEGSVPSYYMKQIAQTLAMNIVAGKFIIDNQVTVQ